MFQLQVGWLLPIICVASGMPEQGKFSATLKQDVAYAGFVKTLDKNSQVRLRLSEVECKDNVTLTWLLRSASCYGAYETIAAGQSPPGVLRLIYSSPYLSLNMGNGYYLESDPKVIECIDKQSVLDDFTFHNWTLYPVTKPTTISATTPGNAKFGTANKRPLSTKYIKNESLKDNASKPEHVQAEIVDLENSIAAVQHTAPYILIIHIDSARSFSVNVEVEMETPLGYLSVHDRPLKTFYMVMCIMYSLYAAAWFVMSVRYFRELVYIQFWIGGVVLLGMTEKVVLYSEYLTLNTTGSVAMGMMICAEIVSALRRSVCRMLLLIISLRFRIVESELRQQLPRVVGIGGTYFIVTIVEAFLRNHGLAHLRGNLIFMEIPLAVVDSVICLWILINLLKVARRSSHAANLSLYRDFLYALVFCIITSLIMITYVFHNRDACDTAWKEKWISDAFWHILFTVLLLVIILLWRPNGNNQKNLFSPLLNANAEESVDVSMLLPGSAETTKMQESGNASGQHNRMCNFEGNVSNAVMSQPTNMDFDVDIVTYELVEDE